MADAWSGAVSLAYGPLARHLVARAPEPVQGSLALDAGAGSGLAGDALRALGARVVAIDRELDMAKHVSRSGPAVVGDVSRIPLASGRFDLVVAAFVVNHLPDPVAGLAEMRRVTRSGGVVLASSFSNSRADTKAVVDAVAQRHGFVPPPWYADIQQFAHAVGEPVLVERALADAGYASWTVTQEPIDVGMTDPAEVVRYRLSMPQFRDFVTGLAPRPRATLVAEATDAVREAGTVFAPIVIEAVATA